MEQSAIDELRKLYRAVFRMEADSSDRPAPELLNAAQIAAEVLTAYRTIRAELTESLLRSSDLTDQVEVLTMHVGKLTELKAQIRRARSSRLW